MNAHENIERQLVDAVQRARLSPSPRQSRLRRRGLAFALVPLVFAAAAAGALIAQQPSQSATQALLGRVLALSASKPVCTRTLTRHSLSNDPPLAQIVRPFPQLASYPNVRPAPAALALAQRLAADPVLVRTVRTASFPDGVKLVLFVSEGLGLQPALLDRQACLRLRLATLARLLPNRGDPLRRAVSSAIAAQVDTLAGTESVWLWQLHLLNGEPNIDDGTDATVTRNDPPLSGGVWTGGGPGCGGATRCFPSIYEGVVSPSVATVAVVPGPVTGRYHAARYRRRVRVQNGLFAFTLPSHHGPELVLQLSARGRVLRSQPLP
jgi:hypothetical protein